METKTDEKLPTVEEKASLKMLAFSSMFFSVSLITALLILPENCGLLENDPEGVWLCHSIPNNCCVDKTGRFFARAVVFVGLSLTVAPYIFVWINARKSKDKFKLFD
ncbi:MAG TPA: hypothetical protein VGB00_03870 [Pyrinomonadaceae bacterium]|jgi:hypothetical protein